MAIQLMGFYPEPFVDAIRAEIIDSGRELALSGGERMIIFGRINGDVVAPTLDEFRDSKRVTEELNNLGYSFSVADIEKHVDCLNAAIDSVQQRESSE